MIFSVPPAPALRLSPLFMDLCTEPFYGTIRFIGARARPMFLDVVKSL
jgi:hypothetical protein